MSAEHHEVLIVGTGFAGIGMAIALREAGIDDVILLERAGDLGGVWRENTYPGAACDVESHLYALSVAPNPDWSHRYPPQGEIWAYMRQVADRFGITPRMRFHQPVTAARWDNATSRWTVTTPSHTYTARYLVAATGALADPEMPDLPDLASFQGPVFHSAQWDHTVPLEGRRVAVLGTGASAVQFVPAIQPRVAHLTVFQRTPAWVVSRHDHPFSPRTRALFRRMPALQRAYRRWIRTKREVMGIGFWHPGLMRVLGGIARVHLHKGVRDPALRAILTPDYTVGCKRILVSDDYYPALVRPNVTVVPRAAVRIAPDAVITGDGQRHPADVLICGTGFRVTEFPFAPLVTGRDGRTLADTWGATAVAHAGTTVAGFPNLFLIPGPNTGLGHSSVLLMFEAQIAHVTGAIREAQARGASAVEPRPEAQAAFVAAVNRKMAGTVWVTGGCRSWYLDATGRNSTLWPGTVPAFERRVARFRPEEYHFLHA